ncbi:hypothetical protein L1987_46423 [Smallanthus sonchifolius]|uniref:Uncharacterized protein n=1 Tax=Smallanthus sonchifolius TaxID=185202 RepID=A0ACB9G1G0_9ASTR|nr:hypothetical protein L1987_46423 [Smallanthus sonchifolius]
MDLIPKASGPGRIAGRVIEDLTLVTPSLALWCTVRLAGGSASPMIGNGIGLVERTWLLQNAFKRSRKSRVRSCSSRSASKEAEYGGDPYE